MENPLKVWRDNFGRDVQTLRQLTLLRTRRSDEATRKEMRPLFQTVAESLSDLEAATASLKSYLAAERTELIRFQGFRSALATQKHRIAAVRANIPAELRETLDFHSDEKHLSSTITPTSQEDSTHVNEKENHHHGTNDIQTELTVPQKKTVVKKNRPVKPAVMKSKVQRKTSEPLPDEEIATIRTVDQEDLDSAPQYVRGRLTVEKISLVVERLNNIVRDKYKLLQRPFRDLNSTEMSQRQDMQDAECPETKGTQHFLTDTEIRVFGAYRMDATVKSAINMLRHTRALKEVRGKNRTRIFIIQ